MNPESSTEQAIKALQAQNAQFQEMVMSLAQGQQELKTLLMKKKKKGRTVLFNSGRRFGNTLQNEADQATSYVGKDSPQGEGFLVLWSLTMRRISMMNSTLLMRTGTSN